MNIVDVLNEECDLNLYDGDVYVVNLDSPFIELTILEEFMIKKKMFSYKLEDALHKKRHHDTPN